MIIYKVTNLINGKIYIGQTINSLEHRIKNHKSAMNDNIYFHSALRKYGMENFQWDIIEECETRDELNDMEFHYIKQYNSFGKNGYNLTQGQGEYYGLWGEKNGMYGKNRSIEVKERISKAKKGNLVGYKNGMYGKNHSIEVKERISKLNKGNRAWNKGTTAAENEKMKEIHKKRKNTMTSKNLFKKEREHPMFKELNEDFIIDCFKKGWSKLKIARSLGTNKSLIYRRIDLLKRENKIE